MSEVEQLIERLIAAESRIATQERAIEMLRKAAKEAAHCIGLLTPDEICDVVHHAKHDQHGIGEVCPVAMSLVSAHQDLELALKETQQ